MKTIVKLGIVAGAGGLAYAGVRRLTGPVELPGAPGETVTIAGEQIHLVDRGSGPAIVLLHGFGGSTFSWRLVIDELAKRHRVAAFDFPGFGFSDRSPELDFGHEAQARRVIAVMDHLGIERATLIGHSMGGGIAQRAAAEFPERVERLVLVASVNAAEPVQQRGSPPPFAAKLASLSQRIPKLWLITGKMSLQRTVANPAAVDRAMVEGYMAPLLVPGTVEAIFSMAERVKDEALVDLSKISAPTLILAGADDKVVPAAIGEALAAAIASSRLLSVPAAAHMVAEEQPEKFLAEVEKFLTTTTAH
ncbi:MAG: alpha/beta hydrolase [bacterium]